jgi:acyl-CoA synthetase (NDP forming)
MQELLEPEVLGLLSEYGIQSPNFRLAKSEQEAVKVARELGFPLVMKIVSPDILHKTDVGGVRIGLKDVGEVKSCYDQMMQDVARCSPNARLEGVILYTLVSDGPEVIIGLTQDVTFGTVLMFGLGGVFTEALCDITFRAVPIQRKDALQMIKNIKNTSILKGWRGQRAVNIDELADLLCKVSQIAVEHPEIEEMDLNPVRMLEAGLFVLDGKILKKS